MSIIEIITRALMFKNNEILTAFTEGDKHAFLPRGHHVEFGEFAKTALKRELEDAHAQ